MFLSDTTAVHKCELLTVLWCWFWHMVPNDIHFFYWAINQVNWLRLNSAQPFILQITYKSGQSSGGKITSRYSDDSNYSSWQPASGVRNGIICLLKVWIEISIKKWRKGRRLKFLMVKAKVHYQLQRGLQWAGHTFKYQRKTSFWTASLLHWKIKMCYKTKKKGVELNSNSVSVLPKGQKENTERTDTLQWLISYTACDHHHGLSLLKETGSNEHLNCMCGISHKAPCCLRAFLLYWYTFWCMYMLLIWDSCCSLWVT